jgi:hypothetical protein
MSRPLRFFFSCLPIAAASAALLFGSTGCNPIGCFQASEAGGTCPAQEDALPYFGDPTCGGTVASVDSEPSIQNGEGSEGALCCYAITTQEKDFSGCDF